MIFNISNTHLNESFKIKLALVVVVFVPNVEQSDESFYLSSSRFGNDILKTKNVCLIKDITICPNLNGKRKI